MDLLPYGDYARSLNRKRVSAGVLFHDGDRVLLVEPSYKPTWEIPGGSAEPEEPPWRTAAREVAEELGADWPPGRLLLVDHQPTAGEMPEGLAFVFDGGPIGDDEVAALVVDGLEVLSAALVPVEVAVTRLNATLARRVVAALGAVRSGELVFCQNGGPVYSVGSGSSRTS